MGPDRPTFLGEATDLNSAIERLTSEQRLAVVRLSRAGEVMEEFLKPLQESGRRTPLLNSYLSPHSLLLEDVGFSLEDGFSYEGEPVPLLHVVSFLERHFRDVDEFIRGFEEDPTFDPVLSEEDLGRLWDMLRHVTGIAVGPEELDRVPQILEEDYGRVVRVGLGRMRERVSFLDKHPNRFARAMVSELAGFFKLRKKVTSCADIAGVDVEEELGAIDDLMAEAKRRADETPARDKIIHTGRRVSKGIGGAAKGVAKRLLRL